MMGQYEGGAFKPLKREVCRDTDIYSQFLLLYIWLKNGGGASERPFKSLVISCTHLPHSPHHSLNICSIYYKTFHPNKLFKLFHSISI